MGGSGEAVRAGRGSVTTHITGKRRHEAGMTPDANTLRSCVMWRKGGRTHGHTYGHGGMVETPEPTAGLGDKVGGKSADGRRSGWATGWGDVPVPVPYLGDLKDVEFTGVFEGLPAVAEPDADDFAVVVELLGDLGDLLAGGQGVLLEVGVESLNGLGGEGGTALPFFGGFPPDKFHQVLLPLLVTELGFAQPLLQHRFQLLGALGGDVQLLEPAVGTEKPSGMW